MAIATASIGINSAECVLGFDPFGHTDAIYYLKAEIVKLLQHATIYSLTTMLRDVLQRYVFMLRGLMDSSMLKEPFLCTLSDQVPQPSVIPLVKCASPGCFGRFSKANRQVDSSDKAPALPATAQLVHDMSTLQPWHDGLESLKHLLTPKDPLEVSDSTAARPVPDRLEIQTLADWEWYVELVQLPRDASIQKHGPPSQVPVSALLELLGVGPTTLPSIQQQLRAEHIPLLRQAVLPKFIDEVIADIDKQVPALDLSARHAQTPLLHGVAQTVRTLGMMFYQQRTMLHNVGHLSQIVPQMLPPAECVARQRNSLYTVCAACAELG